MNIYMVITHGQCPVDDSWDYYNVAITSKDPIPCEDIRHALSLVAGAKRTQEEFTKIIHTELKHQLGPDSEFKVELEGFHPQSIEVTSSLPDDFDGD